MELTVQLLVFSSFFVALTVPVRSVDSCEPVYCDPAMPDTYLKVQFPFLLKGRQPDRCGQPGFELYCNSQNQTILNLPESGEFVVGAIDYIYHTVLIGDPGHCLPNRAVNFSLARSPFRAGQTDVRFFDCSNSSLVPSQFGRGVVPLRCLGEGINHTFVAAAWSKSDTPPGCQRIGHGPVPLLVVPTEFFSDFVTVAITFELTWSRPAACGRCEIDGEICGYESESSQKIGCYRRSKPGLPEAVKYALIGGVGVPGLICIIGLACYARRRIQTADHQRRLGSQLRITALSNETSPATITGLDQTTIASFPMTVLGESRRLPEPCNDTCPICLCEYEPKEALRSIPECNHYFHANCVDEWLTLNGSCPVCRNSSNATATPHFSVPEMLIER